MKDTIFEINYSQLSLYFLLFEILFTLCFLLFIFVFMSNRIASFMLIFAMTFGAISAFLSFVHLGFQLAHKYKHRITYASSVVFCASIGVFIITLFIMAVIANKTFSW